MSLLLSAGIPTKPDLLDAWAGRIRDRVGAISKRILSLELEKQDLLALLDEAGFSAFCIQEEQPQFTPSVASRKSIIDLEDDEESVAETLRLPDSLPLNEEIDENQQLVCDSENHANVEFDEELEGINPMDLTYDEDHCLNKQEDRVFSSSEFQLIDWNKVSASDLKEWAKFFGMKPALGKQFLIAEFKNFFQYLGGGGQKVVADSFAAEKSQTEKLHEDFVFHIKSNPTLYDRILLFESVEIGEVYEFLKTKIMTTGFSLKCVKDFFTQNQLHFSNTAGNLRRKKRGAAAVNEQEPPPKTRRQLRRSITCP